MVFRDLWIDGNLFDVDQRVWAHLQYLTALSQTLGEKLTAARIKPLSDRWTAQRKWSLLMCVEVGTMSKDQALALFDISAQEWDEWAARYQTKGMAGLMPTYLQGAP